jgi:hypothetical protein
MRVNELIQKLQALVNENPAVADKQVLMAQYDDEGLDAGEEPVSIVRVNCAGRVVLA